MFLFFLKFQLFSTECTCVAPLCIAYTGRQLKRDFPPNVSPIRDLAISLLLTMTHTERREGTSNYSKTWFYEVKPGRGAKLDKYKLYLPAAKRLSRS